VHTRLSLVSSGGVKLASPTAMTGAVVRIPGRSVSGTIVLPSWKLNLTEYFEEHCSPSQKKMVARAGFKLQMVLGTSVHGVLGDVMSKR